MYLINIFFDLFILLFFIRIFLTPRDYYFNPFFDSLTRITDPILNLIRSPHRLSGEGDYSPFVPIFVLILLHGLLSAVITPLNISDTIISSFKRYLDLLFQLYAIIAIIIAIIYDYHYSTIVEFSYRMAKPIYAITKRVLPFGRERGYLAIVTLIILHLFLSVFLWEIHSLLNLNLLFSPEPSFLLKRLIDTLTLLLDLTGFFTFVIIIAALLSWVSPDPRNPVVNLVYSISEPILYPIRRIIPLIAGIDLSPIFAILFLQLINYLGKSLLSPF